MTFSGRKDNEIVYYDLMLSSKKRQYVEKKDLNMVQDEWWENLACSKTCIV